jgi:hypothetical protein
VNRWEVKSSWVFLGIGALVVAYILSMMVRRRKGEREVTDRDPDL